MQMLENFNNIIIISIIFFLSIMFIFYKDYISILLNIETIFLFCLLFILVSSIKNGNEGFSEQLSLILIVIVASETTLVLSIFVRIFYMKKDIKIVDRLVYKEIKNDWTNNNNSNNTGRNNGCNVIK